MIDRWNLMQRLESACAAVPPFDLCGAVLDGQARIVDCFDHGDHRFVVLEPGAHVPLTSSERSVVLRLGQELSNKVVALDLAISQATASSLLSAALRKLGVDRGTLLRALSALIEDEAPVL